jgi:H+/Cl- antiporter ClcA
MTTQAHDMTDLQRTLREQLGAQCVSIDEGVLDAHASDWSDAQPGTPLGAFAVIGAAAFLASSMRVPLTALALIFEFTHPSQEFLIPMLIAVAGSVLTAEYVRSAMAASASRRVVQAGAGQTNA